jgi:hypothetical protein
MIYDATFTREIKSMIAMAKEAFRRFFSPANWKNI